MKESPLIDTHIDLPQIIRSLDRHPLSILPDLATYTPGHIDIPRLRKGRLGAAFWTVWAPCPDFLGIDVGADYNNPNDGLRDALEVLDLINQMISSHPEHLQHARSSHDIRSAFESGKVASLLGMEGTHFLGNSLSTVRLFAQLGVRYVSLTHMCHSAFASSSGFGKPMAPSGHEGGGLSDLGRELIAELNRLGLLVDLSHSSDETARQAIALSKAPVVWTHSVSRALHDHPRNVPDDVLEMIGSGEGKNRGVVQCVFFPAFVGPTVEAANVSTLADHIEHVAGIVGRKHVGIGSDFDGMFASVRGLEDASKYPNLITEMLIRDWSDDEIKDLMGRNLMRVMDEADAVSESLKHEKASTAIWEKRTDLPAQWGGDNNMFYPYEVQDIQAKIPQHDEL
ncbi:putative membrane dipeptidase [Diaporthe ampelina]|uniref:Dipeptidase n=1 Tax=Diaporthe ampelina TaxID=1214573 RepID=A0A0G2HXS0_9PEZI|nr:putative membrane dipeptidase [Diaporthe ampelina]